MKTQNLQIKDISRFLMEREIKPSYQRVRILERLLGENNHPTVNDIYTDLIEEIPSLSKTTVYNTLNLFMENGIVRSFSTDSNESRYDIDRHSHGHFICVQCKKIYDFELDESELPSSPLGDVTEREITLRGICTACKKEKKS